MGNNLYIKAQAPSGETTVEGWYRPSWWLEQPTIGDENVVWELMIVFPGNQNPYTRNLQSAGGVTTEFYTDKDAPTPFYTATANNNTLIDYKDCNPITGQFIRQCWVKSFPYNSANNWSTVDFVMAHSVYGNYNSQICERLISCKTAHPTNSGNHRMGWVNARALLLENVEYRNRMPFVNLSAWLYNARKLKRVYSEEVVTIQGNMNNAFANCALMTPPENIAFAPSYISQMYNDSNMTNIVLDFANSTVQNFTFLQSRANTIIGLNMASVTQSVGDFTDANLYYLELHGYRLGHSLNGNSMRGGPVFKAWVDSLGNASGTQTITVSTVQYTSFGGVSSYVDNELFNKGYILNVV